MTPEIFFNLAALAVIALGAWRGWSTGAVRTLVGVAAALLGIYVAAAGRAPVTSLVSGAFPDADPLLIGAFVVVGGAWLVIWIGSLLLGATLRALLRIVRLGGLDSLIGALLGASQGALLIGAIVFVADALRSFGAASGSLASIVDAISASTAATVVREAIFPFVGTLIGGWLPEALRRLLAP